MDAGRRGLVLKLAGAAVGVLVVLGVFAAYLSPNMAAVYGDVMSFCAALLK